MSAFSQERLEEINEALDRQVTQLTNERDALLMFAKKVFDASGWPEGAGIDNCDLQDIAAECGLLAPVTVHGPCGDTCHCADFHGDFTDGVTCYRKTAILNPKQ